MIPIFEMSEEEIDQFLEELEAPVNEKTRKIAAQAFRAWIEEYFSEGNISMRVESVFETMMRDTK